MGPSVLMFYGSALPKPVFVIQRNVEDLSGFANFWGGNSFRVVPEQLAERPYVNIAIFWRPWLEATDSASVDDFLATLKPEEAHQHGRMYPATRQVRAAVVTTDYARFRSPAPGAPARTPSVAFIQPVPHDVREFVYGAWLTEADLQIAKKLRLPTGIQD